MTEIQRVTVSDLLEQSVVHEHWITPIDPNLRTSLYWCSVGTAVAVPVGLFGTPLLTSWAYDGVFFFLGPLAVLLLSVLSTPFWIGVNAVGIALFGVLYWQSEKLTAAVMTWHWVGTALVVLGALNIVAMTLPLAIVALNIVAWIVLGILVVAAIFIVLAGAAVVR